jgi:hypothetical protein
MVLTPFTAPLALVLDVNASFPSLDFTGLVQGLQRPAARLFRISETFTKGKLTDPFATALDGLVRSGSV